MPGEKLIQSANIWLSCTNYAISAGLLWWIILVHRRGLQTAKISASVEKSENWNMESWLVPLMVTFGEKNITYTLYLHVWRWFDVTYWCLSNQLSNHFKLTSYIQCLHSTFVSQKVSNKLLPTITSKSLLTITSVIFWLKFMCIFLFRVLLQMFFPSHPFPNNFETFLHCLFGEVTYKCKSTQFFFSF